MQDLTSFFECADPAELKRRFKPEISVTEVEVEVT